MSEDILSILDRMERDFYGPYGRAAQEIRSLRKQIEDVRAIVRPASRYSVDMADSVKIRSYDALRSLLYDQRPQPAPPTP
jgi:hypothetical protein